MWTGQQGAIGRRQFLIGNLLVIVSCLIGQAAFARGRDCRPLKFGHPFQEKTLFDNWAKDFQKRLIEIDSKIEVDIIPLQRASDLVEGILHSIFDLALVPANEVALRVPEWHVLSFPALYTNLDVVNRLRHHKEFINRLAQSWEKKGAFLVTLAWIFYGLATQKVVHVPEDLKGLKIWVWRKYHESLLHMAGASPKIMPFAEVYTALQEGVIDGTIASYQAYKMLGQAGLIKNLTWSLRHSIFNGAYALISNAWFWDKTGKDLQPNLMQIGNESASLFEASYQEAISSAVNAVREAGVTITELTQEDYKKWVDFSKLSAWNMFEKAVKEGKDLIELAQQVQNR